MISRRFALLASLSFLLLACSAGAAAPTPSGSPSPTATPAAQATSPSPSEPDEPVGSAPGGGEPGDPGAGAPQIVFPKPGTLNPRLVGVSELEAEVDGRQVIVKASWWSGVEPCHVLDSVGVQRDATTITIGLREGTGDPGAMCIEIAQLKATLIDLGELEPGTYTIQAAGEGEAKPITVTVS